MPHHASSDLSDSNDPSDHSEPAEATESTQPAEAIDTPETPKAVLPHMVGVGASAGGLEALRTFFAEMPVDSGLTFIVIQHLAPNHKSLMVELLQRATRIPVQRAAQDMLAEPNQIYLIPPGYNLTLVNKRFQLTPGPKGRTLNLPIDICFRSLAADCGEHAIAVILSGTGSDGARGIRAIKEAGGMIMVQAEASAKFAGMPTSAIATGAADFVLPAEEMPAQLLKFISHPFADGSRVAAPTLLLDNSSHFENIIRRLREVTGIDFSLYKQATFARRIERRMHILQANQLQEYIKALYESRSEALSLGKDLLISVTKFFRDSEAFTSLNQQLAELFAAMQDGECLRIWVAACATGEEAYSLAILCEELRVHQFPRINYKVFATDVDRDALECAGSGIYPRSVVADLPPHLLEQYFQPDGAENFKVSRTIRDRLIFASQDLLSDPPFTRIHLVSCRNLLIYLRIEAQRKLLSQFHFSLLPGGLLFLGGSETLGELSYAFDMLDSKHRMFQDIHTSKTTREALRQSEEKFRKFVENAYDIVYSLSPEGIFTYISPNWQDFMGEPAELAIGRSYDDYVHPEDVHLCRDYLRQVLSGAAKPEHPHYRVRRTDGTWRWHISNGSQLTNDCGETIGYVGIAHDNTERKQAEQKILQTNKALENAIRDAEKLAHEAQQANRAKSEFLANMSHEIRTPMNGVIGMTGLLLETELNPEQKQYAEIVRTSGESLLGLLNDILDFSKIEAGKVDLEAFDFNLEDLLDDCAASMAAKSYEQGLEIITVVDPAVPVHLVGDLGRLRQILNNLLGNALKFTEQGEICLRVSRTEAEDGPSGSCLLRFSVKDSGPGIPKHKRQLLFRQFSQLDASTIRKFGGTGLGLAISKQLAKLMGGTIGVESAIGRGSEFWFTARLSTGKAVRPQAPELAGIRVLLVDDCTTRRDSLQARLSAWGMQPATAADSDAARAQLGQAAAAGTPFSIVLIDAGLKGVSGEQLGREIKTLPEHRDCQLVLLAAMGTHPLASKLLSIGFSAHLAKPLLLRDLFSVLVELAQLSPGEAARPVGPGNKASTALNVQANYKGRILLAEDNITNQQVALGILKKMGLKADAVANGLEVVEALRSLPYDLVLMDVQMPELDGIAATVEIRDPQSGVLNPQIPIIAMTACAMQGDQERCLQVGMDDYMPKPISLQAVSEMLHKWLHLTPDHDAPAADGLNPPASAADTLPAVIWDGDDLLQQLLGDAAVTRQVLDDFLSDLPPMMARLNRCLDASDTVNAASMTHNIKGMALTVGALAVSDVAANIELALQESDFPQARMLFEELHIKTKATCGLMQDRSRSD